MQRKFICFLNAALLICVIQSVNADGNGRTEVLTIDAVGYKWQCYVHLPPSYNKKEEMPLLLILHGAGGGGMQFMNSAKWDKKSDEKGFIVAAPDGQPVQPSKPENFWTNPRTWNSGQLRAASVRSGIDDIGFFKILLTELEKRYSINKHCLYLTGHSNGAGMTFELASEMADKFTAIAPVASVCWVKDPKPSRPVPTIFIIGTKDKLVPIQGGTSTTPWGNRETPPVEESLSRWAEAIGCSKTPTRTSNSNVVKTMSYQGKVMFLAYYVDGQGHNWPGGNPTLSADIAGPNNPDFNATDRVWEFVSVFHKQ